MPDIATLQACKDAMAHVITAGDVVEWIIDGAAQAVLTIIIVLALREMLHKPNGKD